MKFTNEHYQLLKEQIENGIDHIVTNNSLNSRGDFFKVWEENYSKYTEQRKIWDVYWACGGNAWKNIAFNGNPYGGDYNDSHITTAIKKIYKELS